MVMVKKLSPMVNSGASSLLFLLCILGSISCGNKQSKGTIESAVVQKHDVSVDSTVKQGVKFKPDSTINDILILNNKESSTKFYPKISSEKLIDSIRESPVLGFNNEIEKEYLLLYQHEGGVRNEFSCFEIGYINELEINITTTDYKYFETESGLKLGLSLDELIKIKGNTYYKEGNKIIYRIDDYPNSNFLKRYNMPTYFLECTLQNGKVNKIKFGFDYP